MRFGANFFVSPTGPRHLWEMKTRTNDENYIVAIKAPYNFSEMVNGHFNVDPCLINSFLMQIKVIQYQKRSTMFTLPGAGGNSLLSMKPRFILYIIFFKLIINTLKN